MQAMMKGTILVSNVIVDPTDAGHLKCRECNTYWCEHVHEAVNRGMDARLIHEYLMTEPDAWNEWITIEVPIVPSSNQWAPVRLTATKINNQPMWTAIYPGPDANEENFLGFLNEGEGRFVLRSMVWDWFQGAVDFKELACGSRAHKWPAQKQWEKDMKGTAAFAQYWSTWTTGKCLICAAGSNAGTDPDLIPDNASAPFNPFAGT